MNRLLRTSTWLAGLQWLFFIFTNIVVIPLTVGAALQLPQDTVVSLMQLSFMLTGLACILQAVIGHQRAILEGNSGLWWGVFLTLVTTSSAQGMSLETLGGSLTVGVIISGFITMLIGLSGLGRWISSLFKPAVMGVFLLLLGAQLIGIFFKGMLGIPFGNETDGHINISIAILSIILVAIIIMINIKAPSGWKRYSLLTGIIIGWIAYVIIFKPPYDTNSASFGIEVFPLGKPTWDTGIIITAILAGLLNLANTSVALKGTEDIYHTHTTKKQYRSSFTISGIVSAVAGILGLVPYAPYVASIGFLKQTNIFDRLPFILGGFMFLCLGLFPPIGTFFSNLPLSIGSAVLFVAYLLLFHSSWGFLSQVPFNNENVYRVAIPIFVGIVIMTMPASYFATIPAFIRPLLSNGLLVGISLSVILENVFSWDTIGEKHSAVDSEQIS